MCNVESPILLYYANFIKHACLSHVDSSVRAEISSKTGVDNKE